MTTKQIDNAVNDLKPAVEALLHSEYADGTTIRIDTDNQSTQTPKDVITFDTLLLSLRFVFIKINLGRFCCFEFTIWRTN